MSADRDECGQAPFSLRAYYASDTYPRWKRREKGESWRSLGNCFLSDDDQKEHCSFEVAGCTSYGAAELHDFSSAGRFDFENRHVADDADITVICIENALVCGTSGVVLDSSGDLILESLFPFRRNRPFEHIAGMEEYQRCVGLHECDEDVCLLFGGGGAHNFWHFHVDMLPSVQILQDWNFENVKYALSPGAVWQVEALSRIGVSNSQIVKFENSFYKVRRCLLVSSLFNPALAIPSTTARKTLSRLAATVPPVQKTGVYSDYVLTYVSRQDSTSRLMTNECLLIEKLREVGFEILIMSEIAYADQLSSLKASSVVVGAHGAGLTGVFACRPDTLLVEIFPFGVLNAPHYYFLTNAVGAFYEMHVSSVRSNVSPHHHWSLDVDRFLLRLAHLFKKYNIQSPSYLIDKVNPVVSNQLINDHQQFFSSNFDISQEVYCYGFYSQEDWGFWMVERLGAICFLHNLPKRFTVTIEADFFEPSVKSGLVMEVGESSFRIDQGEMTFAVDNPHSSRTFFFRADGAVSPRTFYNDPQAEARTISLALKSMLIQENPGLN